MPKKRVISDLSAVKNALDMDDRQEGNIARFGLIFCLAPPAIGILIVLAIEYLG